MFPITIDDIRVCISQNLAYDDNTSPHTTLAPITESELMCEERILPEYPISEPVSTPTVVDTDQRLLTFEDARAIPLCLKPPTARCYKRSREEVVDACVHKESKHSSTCGTEEWLSWMN